jgi:glycosyltransferase involved in cell wall biosynthesis
MIQPASAHAPNANQSEPPGLVMVANCMTPYRANLHALLAAGIPELKFHTLISHGAAEFQWSMDVPESIHASYLGEANDSALASPLKHPWREWRKGKRIIDYIHAHNVRAVIVLGYRYLSYLRTMQHCYRHGLPIYSHNDSNIRSDDRLSGTRQFFKHQIYNWWMPRVTGVMSMGEYGDQFYLKYGARAEQIYRVPCTPDYDRYSAIDAQRLSDFRQKFKLSESRKYLLYSGRMVPVKRVDLLIDAFAAIASERPEWNLLLVGDGVLRDELQQRVPPHLRERVVWTGFLEQDESIAAYHAAELFVLPSDHEPWALVVQESMAAGLGVVSSDIVGAARELVEQGVNGAIFPAGNLPALTEALRTSTEPGRAAEFKHQSRLALAEWRKRIDPVAEVRRALSDAGVLRRQGG